MLVNGGSAVVDVGLGDDPGSEATPLGETGSNEISGRESCSVDCAGAGGGGIGNRNDIMGWW